MEGGDLGVALAPAGDLVALPGAQHVAGLVPGGGFARDDVDAVHRNDPEHAAVRGVAQGHGVARAGPPGHPAFAAVLVDRQGFAAVAVDDLDVAQPPQGVGGQGAEEGEGRERGQGQAAQGWAMGGHGGS
ncbi:MAG TPA: hypothetical protein DCY64_18710 [Hydrogenophaga sp.]|nr:hypothetical protein [Hydrogenophaga sp.]HBU20306.1 hypothetical protein [Hydrogenophaga sp.]